MILNYWTEKYRPKSIEDGSIILTDEMKDKFKQYIENEDFPHLMLVGPPGTGKTTIALALINKIIRNRLDLLSLNGSVDNGIDVIRDQVTAFINTPSEESRIKIVFIDECDFMTPNAFAALRALIEQPQYNKHLNTRFIFNCNYINKIPEPIQSRFEVWKVSSLPINLIVERCEYILKNENISYQPEVLNQIVNNYYPDMRSIIKVLQKNSINGTLSSSNIDSVTSSVDKLIKEILDSNNFTTAFTILGELRELLTDDIDYQLLITSLLDRYEKNLHIHHIILKYFNMMSMTVIPRHTIIGMIHEIMLNKFNM